MVLKVGRFFTHYRLPYFRICPNPILRPMSSERRRRNAPKYHPLHLGMQKTTATKATTMARKMTTLLPMMITLPLPMEMMITLLMTITTQTTIITTATELVTITSSTTPTTPFCQSDALSSKYRTLTNERRSVAVSMY